MGTTPATSRPDFALPNSHAAFERANRVIPGGVNSPARAFGAVGGEPPFMARAEGPYLYDIDGHQYIDYIGSWGPMILGHGEPRVRAAVADALERGTSFGAPTEREVEIAEVVAAAVPSIEKVRFVSSGTEAAMSALRVARGVTGRDKVIKMEGHYHGHVDALLVQAGSAATTLGTPNSPGVTKGAAADTILVPVQRRRGRRRRLPAVSRPDRGRPAGAGGGQHGARAARGRATSNGSAR